MLLTKLLAGVLLGCHAAPTGFNRCQNRTDLLNPSQEDLLCDMSDSVYFTSPDRYFFVSPQGNGTSNVSNLVNHTQEQGWNGRTQQSAEPLAASVSSEVDDAYTLNMTLATDVVSAPPSTFDSIMSWMWNFIALPELTDLKTPAQISSETPIIKGIEPPIYQVGGAKELSAPTLVGSNKDSTLLTRSGRVKDYIVQRRPDPPAWLSSGTDLNSFGAITLSWSPASYNGGSSAIDFEIWSCQESVSVQSLKREITQIQQEFRELEKKLKGRNLQAEVYVLYRANVVGTQLTLTDLAPNTVYKIKIRSRNTVGFSDFTNPITVIASGKPTKPNTPVTTQVSNTQVVITWQQPADNGSTISSYSIYVRQSDSLTYSTELTSCDGSTSGVITALSCTIPVATLRSPPFNLPWGSSVFAKVVATNIVGSSIESDPGNGAVMITNPDAPVLLANVAAVTDATKIGLSWSPGTANGGAQIIDHRISWDQGSNNYVTLAVGVVGATYTTTATLVASTTYKFKIEARNQFGFSLTYSNEVSIIAARVSDAPLNLANNVAITASGIIGLTWSVPPYNGGNPIIDYRISYRQQSQSTFVVLTSGVVLTQYTTTSMVPDTVYVLQIEARNIVGYSPYSEPVTIRAAAKPSQPASPVTSVISNSDLVITWAAPNDGGSPITSYTVKIRSSDNVSYFTELVNCFGGNSIILAAAKCTIPIATLQAAPFNLAWGQSVFAKVTATNIVNSSDESQAGNGAILVTNPDAPTSLANDALTTDATQIRITWVAPIFNGGSTLIDYRVSWDLGSNSYQYLQSGVTTTSYTTSVVLTPNTLYKFKIEARNAFGFSILFSNEVVIRAAKLPDPPMNLANNPSVTAAGVLGFTWTEGAYNGGSPIIDYRISYHKDAEAYTYMASGVTGTTYQAGSLVTDALYTIKIESRNLIGYSTFSSEIVIRAAARPTAPTTPSTTVISNTGVRIQWAANYNGGSAITAYEIMIRQVDGVTYSTELTSCDGSSITVLTAATCTIPTSTLLAAPFNLPWGSSIFAKVRASNIVNFSDYSDFGNGAVILTNPDTPVSLQNVAAVTQATYIGLSWTAGAADGGTPVIDYRVSWDQGLNNYVVLASIATTTYTTPATLIANTVYKFKIESRNAFGYSTTFSNEVSIRAAKISDAPISLSNIVEVTASGVIGISWSPGAYDGGSPVIDFSISFKTGTDPYTVLASGLSGPTYTTFGRIPDAIYTFKIQARNLVGFSSFSSEVVIRAAARPSTPVAPTTSVISNTAVTVLWTPPNNGGSAITSYTVWIQQSDGITFSTELTSCNGANASVLAAASCTIPISTLQAAPFNLPWGVSVYAKVLVTNIVNPSDVSNIGNGGIILTNPDTPTNLVNVAILTNASNISIQWTAGAANGGTPVLDYRIWWDEGSNTWIILESGVPTVSYTTTVVLTPNQMYQFKVESRNSFGFSTTFSNTVSILAATTPDAPINLSNNVLQTASGVIGITWNEGSYNGGSTILDYRVSYHIEGEAYSVLAPAVTSTFYTADSLIPGALYTFKVESRNGVSYSSSSPELSVRAAAKPSTPATPSTQVVSNTNVIITWSAPFNGGSPLTSYTILIRNADAINYSAELTNCDGSSTTILNSATCNIPISTLQQAPFSLPWGSSIYAKVIATNLVNPSIESNVGNGAIILTIPDAPLSLDNVASTTDATRIGLSWITGVANGGTPVIDYRVNWDQGTGNYVVLQSEVIQTTYTTVVSLVANQVYNFKIEARNQFGYSTYSNVIEIRAAKLPESPKSLANNPTVTASGVIGLVWAPGDYDGGSPVIDYRVNYKLGANAYTVLASGLAQAFYTANSLTADQIYSFKIESRTLVGYSAYSSEITIRAAAKPDTPALPVTTVVSNTNVVIAWTPPFNGGSPITSYTILIRQSDGETYSTELNYCDGSLSGIMTETSCTISISTLQLAPFSLPWGSSIFAKIIATNVVNPSSQSVAGNGAIILNNPDAPTQLVNVALETDATKIGLTWVAPVANSGTPVIDYSISWDQGTNSYVLLVSGITTTSYTTVVALTPNTVYKFKVKSRNSFDFSTTYSNEASIRAASLPNAPILIANNVAVTASGIVGLTWSPGAYDGGSPVIDYSISYKLGSGAYTQLTSSVLTTDFTANGLIADSIYTFKVMSRTLVGYGEFSSELAVRAAAKPDTPTQPVTSTIQNTDVVITWTAPYDGGSPITAYVVKIRTNDNLTYMTQLDSCNGSNTVIVAAAKCTVPIALLQASPFNLPWGASVFAQVSALNIVNPSSDSVAGNGGIILTNPDLPLSLTNEQAITDTTKIGLSWSEGVANGGTPVIDYEVSWDQGTDSYLVLQSNVVGNSYTTTILLQGNKYYKFKIKSRNSFGLSTAFSNEVVALTAILPDSPINLQNIVAVTTSGVIGLTWSAGVYDGGSPIIDYRISYHIDSQAYSYLTTAETTTSYTANSLVANSFYTFKIEARNDLGYSTYSSEITIRAAAKPDTPAVPVTTVISNTDVVIAWTAPFNGGSPLTSYTILIRQSDGLTYSTELTSCDGSQSNVQTAASCTIPISQLLIAPFSLPWGSSIFAKIIATNVVNPSDASTPGNGAIILTNPDTPVTLENVALVTDATKIGLAWSAGAANGGTPVIDYRVSWDQGTSSYVLLVSGIITTSYTTAVALTPNTVYNFKVESRNAFGFSTTYSNEATIRAASLPNAPILLANNVEVTAAGTVGLTWSPGAYDGGSPVIDYRISYHAGSDAYVVLTTGVTTSSFTASTLTANLIYTFKIESRNLIGYSAYSSEVVIRAAAKPSQPSAPLTSVVSNTGVTITWTPPNDGGSPITSYAISILCSDGTTYSSELTSCDGSNSQIISSASCIIPIATLQTTPFNLPWGASILAKVIATNLVNPSIESVSGNGAVILTNPDVPTTLANVPLITDATKIGLTWQTGAADGGTPVIDYRLSWDQGTNSYLVLDIGIITTSYTTIISLTPDSVYKFRVESRNAFGYSTTYSSEISVRAAKVSDAPTSLENNVAVTASGVIGLTWSAGTYNGGSPVLDYRISYKQGASAYSELASFVSSPSFTASSLVADALYTFKIEARNLVGYSAYSSEVQIRAAAKPDTPAAPLTSVLSNTGVVITWTAPFNGGSAITYYTVKVRQSDSVTFSTELTSCDGSNAGIIAATSCTIPIGVLFAAPFNLVWGASIYATVQATNVVNSSPVSSVGNGAIILTNPDAPVSLVNVASVTDATKVQIQWNEGAANGGTPVIDYSVWWDQGTNQFVILQSGFTELVFTTTNVLTANVVYKFRVQSRNSFGFSTTYSNEVTVLAAEAPDSPINLANIVSTTASGTIGFSWSEGAYNGGSPILDYRVNYKQGSDPYSVLSTGVLSNSYVASGLSPDVLYTFKVESRNLVTYSGYSLEITIRAAAKPTVPIAPTTSVNTNISVNISWTAPFDGGSSLTAYTILIRQSDGVSFSSSSSCDGSQTQIITAASCTIPISVLQAAPFNLPWGVSIYAKVIATNIVNPSDESAAGNGAIILTNPDSPASLQNVPNLTTASQIGLIWSSGAQDGGTPVIDFKISWDQGINTYVVLENAITALYYTTTTTLTANTVYKFKLESRNAFGYSTTFSNEVQIRAASLPDSPTNLANNALVTASGVVGLAWTEGPYNGGSPIIDYRISFKLSTDSTYQILASGNQLTSYTAVSLTPDSVYSFLVESRNLIGYSATSVAAQVRAAAKPDQPPIPTTTVVSNTSVIVAWTAPFNGGSQITAYTIKIRNSDGITFASDLVSCDGSQVPIVAALSCTIPITALQASPFNLPWGSSVWVTVVATNVVNDSVVSSAGNGALIITNPSAPTSLAVDQTNTNASKITFTWSLGALDGGSPVIDYRISWTELGNPYVVLVTNVVGFTYTTTATIAADHLYSFKLESRNVFGYSLAFSDVVQIRAATFPDAPVNLANNQAITASGVVGLTWQEGAYNGGSPVLNFRIWYKYDTAPYVVLVSGVADVFYTATGLIPNTIYTFKVEAINLIGYGLASNEAQVRAAAKPSAPAIPTTTVISNTGVTISWTAPNNGGSPITSYSISVRESNLSTYSTQLTNCDGTDAAIFAAMSCTIPISVLQSAPFNLPWGASVYATILATNIVGTSDASTPGSGGIILTNPDAPQTLQNVPSVTSATQIGLSWVIGVNNGGAPVLDYTIIWDQGTSNYVVLASGVTTTTYTTVTSLIPDKVYLIKILARNSFGLSTTYSNEVSIRAASLPDAPISLSNNVPVTTSGVIGLLFSQGAYNGGSPVLDYSISIRVGTNSYIEIATGVALTSYTATGLTPNSIYSLIVRARNLVGFGGYSAEVLIRAASKPNTPALPTTATVSNTDLVVTWAAPFDGGSPITAYIVQIRYKDGVTFNTQLSSCNGSNPTIVAALSCTIPIGTLQALPFSLVWGDSVYAKVTAINVVNSSDESSQGNGGVLLTNPDPPVNLLNLVAITNSQQIGFEWQNGVANGGTPVIDYRIQFDQSTGNWVTLASGVIGTSYTTTTTLKTSRLYSFKIESRNSFGYSTTTSAVIAIRNSAVPSAPTELANNVAVTTAGVIGLTWIASANNGGSTIIDYSISYHQGGVGGGTYQILDDSVPQTSYTASGLTAGQLYTFKVQTLNYVGYSDFSTELTVRAAQKPSKPQAPTSTVVSNTSVIISWVAPFNGGSAITAYSISIRTSDGVSYSAELTSCNGAAGQIVTDASCTIPISTLQASPFNLPWGSNVFAKVIAINVVNPSDISDPGDGAVILTNPDSPTSLANVAIITDATRVGLTWSAGAAAGGTPVLDYRISWDQGTAGSYVTLISNVAATTYTTTQTLIQNTVYKFKVESRNAFGYSTTYSNEVEILAAVLPDAPISLASDLLVTTSGIIGLTWAEGAYNGGSTILDYRVSYFKGTDAFAVLATGVTTMSYQASSLTPDILYTFRVEARNSLGYSTFSQQATIRAAAKPNTPVAPTTTVVSNTGVTVIWIAPYNGGSAITSYTIVIRQSDGVTFSQDAINCNGADPSVMAATQCTIPIALLQASPFNIAWGSQVHVKMYATNIVNDSGMSSQSLGSIILTNPDPPLSLVNVPSTTSASVIGLQWSEGVFNGGSSIIDYRVSWDQGTGSYVALTTTTTTSYTTTATLVADSLYKFKIESRNTFGYSTLYSNEVTIRAAKLPDAPVSLANNAAVTASGVIGLTWLPGAYDGGSPIIDYRLSYHEGSGSFVVLATGVVPASYTATSLIADTIYTFKIESRNLIGYSVFSSEISIRAAARPSLPEAPTTQINGSNVDITWTSPYNGGSSVTSYSITIVSSDGSTYYGDSASCSGQNPAVLTCSVPIATLKAVPFNLAWGASVFAKVSAINIVDTSLSSLAGNGAIILTYPDAPTLLANNPAVTTAIAIGLTWSNGAATGGTPVIDYRISYDQSTGVYVVLATGVTVQSYQTSGLTPGNTFNFKIEARNAYGYSQSFSNEVSILQAQVPDAPIALTNDPIITSATQIGFTWGQGTYNGASPVLDYKIQYYHSTGVYVDLASGIAGTSFTLTPTTAGNTYKFKILARNIVGYSVQSAELSILASAIPSVPTAPTTSASASQVTVSWTAPYNGGSAITIYSVEIRHNDELVFSQALSDCDGASLEVLAAASCQVNISTLLASPYLLPYGSSIYARVTALNVVGTSLASPVGNGAVILRGPDAPVNLQNELSVTKETQIGLSWTAGAANGGAPVIDYRLNYDQGTGQYVVLQTGISVTTFTVSSTTGGVYYKFKVEARNSFGYSALSNEVTVFAAEIPGAPINLQNDASVTSATQIGLAWDAGSIQDSAILDYRINSDQSTGVWIVIGTTTSRTYTATSLTNNQNYNFKVEARNQFLYSAASSVVTVLSASIPSVVTLPATSVDGNNVVIAWTAPYNGGSPITSYNIAIQQNDGVSYSVDSANCNGQDAAVIAATSCTVPITVLMAAPFSHPWGASISARVIATNIVGSAVASQVGNGAVILTNPDPPKSLANLPLVTLGTQIGISWSQGDANGGTAVIDYRVYYDQGTGTNTFIQLATGVTALQYTATALTTGVSYKFKVQARNGFGYSTDSAEVIILAAQVPDAPLSLANNPQVTGETEIGITWSPPTSNGGSALLDYRISYDQSTGNYIQLAAGVTVTNYLVSSLTKGNTYKFKVEARNAYGLSAFSSEVSILAA